MFEHVKMELTLTHTTRKANAKLCHIAVSVCHKGMERQKLFIFQRIPNEKLLILKGSEKFLEA